MGTALRCWQMEPLIILGLIFLIIIGLPLIKRVLFPSDSVSGKLNKKKVISNPEQVLYHRLKKTLSENHEVLVQVSFSRFLWTKDGSLWASVRQKVADYVITDKAFIPHTIIELDDRSHNAERDQERDNLLKSAGLRVIRWNVKNLPDAQKIKSEIEEHTYENR